MSEALVGALVVQVGQHFLAAEDPFQTLEALVGENADFIGEVLLKLLDLSASICLARSSFSCPLREKMRTSTTVPSIPGGQVSEASRTSPAFSPKIARSSFSSGVNWVSPLGVTLPTRMSLCLILAPMRMIPLSSRSRSACSQTFGISRVISSGPSLVSRASISNSSMWIEV